MVSLDVMQDDIPLSEFVAENMHNIRHPLERVVLASQVRRGLLAAIFKKIGDKDSSQAGLDELYRFQLDHPDVDIAPHIASVSESFKSYITHGLRKAARRHQGAAAGGQQPAPGTAPHQYRLCVCDACKTMIFGQCICTEY